MADVLMTTGRTPTFKLETPRSKCYMKDLPVGSNLTDADLEAIREGMWLREMPSVATGPSELQLITDATEATLPASIGRPVCIWLDGDRSDVKFSGALSFIDVPQNFRAETKVFVPTSIDPGDYLTVVEGSSVSGNYGHLEVGAADEIAVARCIWIGTEWMAIQGVQPFEIGNHA